MVIKLTRYQPVGLPLFILAWLVSAMRIEESMMEMMGEKERRTGKERLINKDVKSDATWDQPPS